MLTTNIILVVLGVIVLLASCFCQSKSKLQFWMRLISSVLIVTCGDDVVQELFGYSWVISLVIMALFLLAVSAIAQALDNFCKKKASKKNS